MLLHQFPLLDTPNRLLLIRQRRSHRIIQLASHIPLAAGRHVEPVAAIDENGSRVEMMPIVIGQTPVGPVVRFFKTPIAFIRLHAKRDAVFTVPFKVRILYGLPVISRHFARRQRGFEQFLQCHFSGDLGDLLGQRFSLGLHHSHLHFGHVEFSIQQTSTVG